MKIINPIEFYPDVTVCGQTFSLKLNIGAYLALMKKYRKPIEEVIADIVDKKDMSAFAFFLHYSAYFQGVNISVYEIEKDLTLESCADLVSKFQYITLFESFPESKKTTKEGNPVSEGDEDSNSVDEINYYGWVYFTTTVLNQSVEWLYNQSPRMIMELVGYHMQTNTKVSSTKEEKAVVITDPLTQSAFD